VLLVVLVVVEVVAHQTLVHLEILHQLHHHKEIHQV
jgi:hypothetical protein